MNVSRIRTSGLLFAAAIAVPLLGAQDAQAPQAPVVNIDPNRHGNLAAAQGDIVDAYQRIDMAQSANNDQLGGHAQKAKDFLAQADGNWTIYAQNIDQPGGSTKFVQIQQFGPQLSGHFKGPHQSGGIEGFVNVHHIEFSTHTRDVLTFRGQIQGNTMSGLYGMHGQHAPWNAVRSD
jgi:hypothetical protein